MTFSALPLEIQRQIWQLFIIFSTRKEWLNALQVNSHWYNELLFYIYENSMNLFTKPAQLEKFVKDPLFDSKYRHYTKRLACETGHVHVGVNLSKYIAKFDYPRLTSLEVCAEMDPTLIESLLRKPQLKYFSIYQVDYGRELFEVMKRNLILYDKYLQHDTKIVITAELSPLYVKLFDKLSPSFASRFQRVKIHGEFDNAENRHIRDKTMWYLNKSVGNGGNLKELEFVARPGIENSQLDVYMNVFRMLEYLRLDIYCTDEISAALTAGYLYGLTNLKELYLTLNTEAVLNLTAWIVNNRPLKKNGNNAFLTKLEILNLTMNMNVVDEGGESEIRNGIQRILLLCPNLKVLNIFKKQFTHSYWRIPLDWGDCLTNKELFKDLEQKIFNSKIEDLEDFTAILVGIGQNGKNKLEKIVLDGAELDWVRLCKMVDEEQQEKKLNLSHYADCEEEEDDDDDHYIQCLFPRLKTLDVDVVYNMNSRKVNCDKLFSSHCKIHPRNVNVAAFNNNDNDNSDA